MSYREVTVIEIKEVLRLWLRSEMGLRPIAEYVGCDRKTVRRYVDAACAAGLTHGGGEGQLTDGLLGQVVEAVRPRRPSGHGAAWAACAAEHDRIKAWLKDGLTLTKVADLLGRRGVEVPYRTFHRYAATELGFGRQASTVRVADGEPGVELQVDYGRMGLLADPESGRRNRQSQPRHPRSSTPRALTQYYLRLPAAYQHAAVFIASLERIRALPAFA